MIEMRPPTESDTETTLWYGHANGYLRLTEVRNATFCAISIYNASFYQDRLGTNTGKTQKRVAFRIARGKGRGFAGIGKYAKGEFLFRV